MSMVPFHNRLPDLAAQETRAATIQGRDDLPDGEYGFVESFCDDAKCDCRRVIIHVFSRDTGSKVWATISYGWESPDFYVRWVRNAEAAEGMSGATLDPLNPQTQYSHVLLSLFEWMLQDEVYAKRIETHYWLFKEDVNVKRRSTSKRRKRGRR